MKLPMLSPDETLAEIRRLYFQATKQTIEKDLQRALELLKAMPNEDQRERATVYMEGLAEMYKDWRRKTNTEKSRVKSQKSKVKT